MKRPDLWKKIVLVLGIVVVVGVVLGVGSVFGVFWWYGRGVAELDEERLRNYRPPQVTRILSADGHLIGEIYTQRRTFIRYEDIPTHVENAFLAAEDADFYKHEGMDYFGMVRALFINLRAGEVKQGASTITQQVVKNFMLSPERSLERKVQELILARRLEEAFSKKEILELYLNEIYLGHGRYGIEEASQFYFGKSVRDIDLGQAALLATLPKAPGRDSPFKSPDRSKQRQTYVLRQLVEQGFVKAADAEKFIVAGLDLADPKARVLIEAGAEEFVDAARQELVQQYGAEALDTLGARVTTTVRLDVQRATRNAVVEGLRGVDVRNKFARKLKPAATKDRDAALQTGRNGRFAAGEVLPAVIEARPTGVELPSDGFAAHVGDRDVFVRVREGSRYDDPDATLEQQFPPGAVIQVRVHRIAESKPYDDIPAGWAVADIAVGPEAAVVIADVETGEVIAMIGGSTFERGAFNRVTQAARQPGSAFKPFVYGAALLSKQWTAATLVSDSPEIYEKWRPTNYEADTYLGDVRIRFALTKSINTVAIKLADQLGVEKVIEFANAAGITSELPPNLSLALGTGEVTPYEMMRGYLTLARRGARIEPTVIRSVELPDGTTWSPERTVEASVPEDVAFVLTSMMQSVVEEGTGTRAKKLERPAAGKTGTSADFHDAWFAGFTPQRVGITWVGFDRPQGMRGETGGKAAVPIWVDSMKAAHEGLPVAQFVPPPSVSVRLIDATSGLLAPTGEAAVGYEGVTLEEYFVPGTEPVEEAEPAALPATDVVLGLYGETPTGAPGETPSGTEFEVDPSTLEPGTPAKPPAEPEPADEPTPASKLPSLDDEDL